VWIYSLNCALTALVGIGSSLLYGLEQMHIPAFVQMGRDLGNTALSLLAIYLGASIYVIVWASVLATMAQVAVMAVVLRRRGIPISRHAFEWALSRRIFVRSLPFGAFLLVATLNGQISMVMMSILMNGTMTGMYALAITCSAALSMLPAVVAQTVFPVFSRFHGGSPAQLREAYTKTFAFLLVLGVGLGIGGYCVTGAVVLALFGRQYADAVPATEVLVLSQVMAINYVNGALLNATGRQTLFTIVHAIGVGLQLACSWVLIPLLGPLGAAIGFVIPVVVGCVYYTVLCHRAQEARFPWIVVGKCGLAAGGMALALAYSSVLGFPLIVRVVLVGPGTYLIGVLVLSAVPREDWRLIGQGLKPLVSRFHLSRVKS